MSTRPFDMSGGLLAHVCPVVVVDTDQHVLLLTIHRVAFDDRSRTTAPREPVLGINGPTLRLIQVLFTSLEHGEGHSHRQHSEVRVNAVGSWRKVLMRRPSWLPVRVA
jgi:hypothetical protein